jgi:hypothetical protein
MKPCKFDFVGFFCGHGMQFRAIGKIKNTTASAQLILLIN